MELRDIIPAKEIQAKFAEPLTITEYGLVNLDRIIATAPGDVHSTALNVWNRIVQNKLKPVNPKALAKWVMEEDPHLFKKIKQLIGKRVLVDAAYFSAEFHGDRVAKVILFRVFPNNLHLSSVFFRDPAAPLPAAERMKYRTHKGLGLLPTLIAKMRIYAVENGIEYLTLTAAAGDLVPLFEKHGFAVEDNDMGRFCLKTGVCIPMELKLK
jgi:hypothetical protein